MAAATAVAVIGAATAVYSAKQASKNAKRQEKAMQGQQDVAREQLDFGKQQYDDWKQTFQPVYGDLKSMAYEDNRPDYGAIDADVAHAFDTSQGINNRTMQRYGVLPTDGSFQASQRQYGLGRAMAEVGGHQQARRQAKDQKWNKLATFANLGAAQRGQAVNSINQGFGSVQNAFGNQAGLYGQKASEYSQAAAAGAGMLGRGVSMWMNQNQNTGSGMSGINWAGPDTGDQFANYA